MNHQNQTNHQNMLCDVRHWDNRTEFQEESFKNLWEINMKCFQEMYLDTRSTPSSQSVLSTSSSGGDSLAQSALSPVLHATDGALVSHQHPLSVGSALSSSLAAVPPQFQMADLINVQPESQLHYHNQQPAAATVAQQQLALAETPGNNQQQDEISKSLKMFAMLAACKTGAEPMPNPPAPVDAVMQDFACNGYICDELNRYHQYQAALQLANDGGNIMNTPAFYNVNANNILQNIASPMQNNFNVNINDVSSNFWKMLPAHVQQTHVAAATAAAAVNIDYNSNKNRVQVKRFSGAKNDKYTAVKHCVFCENNNEPEAVVKSHAVRDSLGRVLCPKLRTYTCPICKASGDMAHTVKYCPQKPIITMEDAVRAESYRLAKGTYYKQQMQV